MAAWWKEQLIAGEIGICEMVTVELPQSARTGAEMRELRRDISALPVHKMSAQAWPRALDIYQLLANRAPRHHRSVKLPDLVIAVCAEEAGWTLVHCDQDYDAIASVTGQSARWVAPRSSL